jgi:hypothetical protein
MVQHRAGAELRIELTLPRIDIFSDPPTRDVRPLRASEQRSSMTLRGKPCNPEGTWGDSL